MQVKKLAIPRWLGYMRQLGCCISSKRCKLEPTCLEIHCRWCIQCERKVPAEQPLAVRQSYQAVRCPQAEKRTSCFSCMGGQESPACLSCIAGQRRADRKECTLICSHLKKGCSRHACFCMLTLLVLTDFLVCVSSLLWCVPSFPVFIFALSLGCCST